AITIEREERRNVPPLLSFFTKREVIFLTFPHSSKLEEVIFLTSLARRSVPLPFTTEREERQNVPPLLSFFTEREVIFLTFPHSSKLEEVIFLTSLARRSVPLPFTTEREERRNVPPPSFF
ncbi:hypothetical protein V8G54_002712, partial [Vigna mungo]